MRLPSAALGLFAFSVLPALARAQCAVRVEGEFGAGAVASGRAIVSTGIHPTNPQVRFYAKTAQGWQPTQAFTVGDFQLVMSLPVAMDGTRALAGNSESTSQAGQAFVFDLVGGQWIPTELAAPSIRTGDFFGSLVALSGDVAVVAAGHFAWGGGDGRARVHVFELGGGSWYEAAEIRVAPSAIAAGGTRIAIGLDSGPSGQVEVYERVGGAWSFAQHLTSSAPPGSARLGCSVAIEGDLLVAGASDPIDSTRGYVEVFRRQAGGWIEIQRLQPDVVGVGDAFGNSVALSGSTLIVGAPGTHAPPGGRVFRFEFDGSRFVEAGSFGPDGLFGLGETLAVCREDAILGSQDDLAFYRLGFAEASPYCPATTNSTGSAAALTVEGCDSLSGRTLTLVASGLPSESLVRPFFGETRVQAPYGDGWRCVGSPSFRLPAGTSSASGRFLGAIDFDSAAAQALRAGRTWYFQAAYRDLSGHHAGFNLTNALAVGATP